MTTRNERLNLTLSTQHDSSGSTPTPHSWNFISCDSIFSINPVTHTHTHTHITDVTKSRRRNLITSNSLLRCRKCSTLLLNVRDITDMQINKSYTNKYVFFLCTLYELYRLRPYIGRINAGGDRWSQSKYTCTLDHRSHCKNSATQSLGLYQQQQK